VSDYHLIFDLNGILGTMGEGQIRTDLMVLRLVLKEFLSDCVKKKTMYIWSLVMKRKVLRHLEIIIEKTGIHLVSFRIVYQSFCFKNDHFLLRKPDMPIFHKSLFDFFIQFLNMTFENTLLVDDMPFRSLFNPPFSAMFFETFYRSNSDDNHLLEIFLPWNLCICLEYRFINL
jgi:hypothetical protein